MKKYIVLALCLLSAGIFVLTSCAPAPSEVTQPELEPSVIPTQEPSSTPVPPTPMPTQIPVFPCDIVFDSDRDGNLEIYTMAPDGSNLVNLTNNPADDFDPVWSPDGASIAFVSNREVDGVGGQAIYTMLPDGSNVTRVSHQSGSSSPDWSPQGDVITFSNEGDIYLVYLSEGREVNLTNSPENDTQPTFSPDGQKIAWIKGEDRNTTLFVMDLDGSNPQQVTTGGTVYDAQWSVDGRIFLHWDNPEGLCFNCVVTSDGKEVIDAGGKGSIQQFLPFWTDDDVRVEMGFGDVFGSGQEDIFLVSETFPDIFKYLTNDPGNDRNPDSAFRCGPTRGIYPSYGDEEAGSTSTQNITQPVVGEFVIGYTGDLSSQIQSDIDKACSELDVQCVKGDNVAALMEMGVDAIVNSSNRWDVMGSSPQMHDAIEKGIPVFVLNAEFNEAGAYNLSVEHEIITNTLTWMFKSMGDAGKFIYYNFGNSDYIQQNIETVLKDYPVITAIKKDADYEGNSFTQQDILNLILSDPEIEGIWSTEKVNDIFWAINDKSNTRNVFTECLARKEELINWKNEMDGGAPIQCIAQIRPSGIAYEGIYTAFFYLSGSKFKVDAFTQAGGNTLRYEIPVITNDNLPEWIGPKLDALFIGDNGLYQTPPLTPSEIKSIWFE